MSPLTELDAIVDFDAVRGEVRRIELHWLSPTEVAKPCHQEMSMSSIVRGVRKYAVKSEAVRQELVRNSVCPGCGGALGSRWECIKRRRRFAKLLTLKDN